MAAETLILLLRPLHYILKSRFQVLEVRFRVVSCRGLDEKEGSWQGHEGSTWGWDDQGHFLYFPWLRVEFRALGFRV